MLKIAIVDDENVQLDLLSKLVKNWSYASGNKISITTYPSAESFLFAYEDDNAIDIILLDIQMKEMDGVSLARKLRLTNQVVQIIFITGIADYIADGYEVSALHYLLKPVSEEKLYTTLNRAVLKLTTTTTAKTIIFPKTSGNIRVTSDDIIYAEVVSHTITLHLKDNSTLDFNMRIVDMERILGEDFFKCHRSYIVSLKHVYRVTRTAMVLDNSIEIPLSRGLYDSANQAFIKFN